jgi:hypothetical protein
MALKADYGLHLLKEGYAKSTKQIFYSLPLDHLSIISPSLFPMMLNYEVGGVEYAVSLDFNNTAVTELCAIAPSSIRTEIQGGIQSFFGRSLTLEFSEPFTFGIEATIGDVQTVEREQFAPLVVNRVFAVS